MNYDLASNELIKPFKARSQSRLLPRAYYGPFEVFTFNEFPTDTIPIIVSFPTALAALCTQT